MPVPPSCQRDRPVSEWGRTVRESGRKGFGAAEHPSRPVCSSAVLSVQRPVRGCSRGLGRFRCSVLLGTLQVQEAQLCSTGPGHASEGRARPRTRLPPARCVLASRRRRFRALGVCSGSSSLQLPRGDVGPGPSEAVSGGCASGVEGRPRGGADPSQNPPFAQCHRPNTLVATALPGHILTFIQGPLARSVMGGSGCQLPCAGITRTAPPRLSRGREACSPQRPHMARCAGFWAECVAEGGSHLTRTILAASLRSWWPGGAWSPWGLQTGGPREPKAARRGSALRGAVSLSVVGAA